MRPPFCPARGWRSIRFFTPASGITGKTDQTIFVVRDGKVAWTYSIPINDRPARFRNWATPRCFPTATSFSAARSARAKSRPTKNRLEHGRAQGHGDSLGPAARPRPRARRAKWQSGEADDHQHGHRQDGKGIDAPVPQAGQSPHLQFRRVRLTKDGTFLAAHLDDNKVVEYDADGKPSGRLPRGGPWAAARLKNGNTLITVVSHHRSRSEQAGRSRLAVLPEGRAASIILHFPGGEPPRQRQHRDLQLVPLRLERPEDLARLGAGAGSDAGEKSRLGLERMEKSRPRPGFFHPVAR